MQKNSTMNLKEMTTKKLWDFAYFAHGKDGQFGGWSSNEVEH